MSSIDDKAAYKTKWRITRYADDQMYSAGRPTAVPDAITGSALPAITEVDGNLLLNEGIAVVLDLAIGSTTSGSFSNANAYLGVGDSNTAEAASQTGLQASTNKLYRVMQASYPSRSAQTVTWRSVFAGTDANFAWNEFTCANGNSDASVNLNRKVSAQGTKASGQTWTLDLAITLS